MRRFQALIFLLPAIGFFLWSFILTDKSLLYSSSSPFVAFQNIMWGFSANRFLVVALYLLLVSSMLWLYRKILSGLIKGKLILGVGTIALFLVFLTFSNPALSYDLYNYIFDAKLVVQYHLDPHTTSAIDFDGKDDWVRFMRNVFFPTTYGYAWTAMILLPFVMGAGKFLLVFAAFKSYALLALGLLFLLAREIYKRLMSSELKSMGYRLALFFAAPLVLIEGLSSAHNDIWMMVWAFASLLVLLPGNMLVREGRSKYLIKVLIQLALSFGLLYISSQIKRSTALLLPVWGIFSLGLVLPWFRAKEAILRKFTLISVWWADIAACVLFIPLVTDLSRQFHPWYLLWSLSFLPFVRSSLLRTALIAFSITSLFRYLPVLYINQYSAEIEVVQKIITWSAVPITLLAYYMFRRGRKV